MPDVVQADRCRAPSVGSGRGSVIPDRQTVAKPLALRPLRLTPPELTRVVARLAPFLPQPCHVRPGGVRPGADACGRGGPQARCRTCSAERGACGRHGVPQLQRASHRAVAGCTGCGEPLAGALGPLSVRNGTRPTQPDGRRTAAAARPPCVLSRLQRPAQPRRHLVHVTARRPGHGRPDLRSTGRPGRRARRAGPQGAAACRRRA